MFLDLVTPEKRLLTGAEMQEVLVPGHRGQLDILPGHAPLVTTLTSGILRYKPVGSTEYQSVAISWGYCEVTTSGVKVLAETAETSKEIEKGRAEEALRLSETKLKEGLTVGEMIKYQRKFKRAQTRLELLKNYSKGN